MSATEPFESPVAEQDWQRQLAEVARGRVEKPVLLVAAPFDGPGIGPELLDAIRRTAGDVDIIRVGQVAPALAPAAPGILHVPPEHERTKQLVSLYSRLGEAQKAIESYAADLEVEAGPLAERVEALERDHGAAGAAVARATDDAAALQEQIFGRSDVAAKRIGERENDIEIAQQAIDRARKEIETIRAELEQETAPLIANRNAAATAASAARTREYELGVQVEDARKDFGRAIETPRARRLARGRDAIKDHIEKIFSRHPGTREAFALDMRIRAELQKMGLEEAKQRLHDAMRSEPFQAELRTQVEAAEKTDAPVRTEARLLEIMRKILSSMGVAHGDIVMTASISKGGRLAWALRGATEEARARALQAILGETATAP